MSALAPRYLRIMVATPTHDVVPVMWAYDYANMAAHSVAAFTANVMRDPGVEFEFGLTLVKGTYLHLMRQELLETALQDGATHLLWLDSDMRFPKEALLRLLGHNKAIVGINYSQRGMPESGPPDFVAIKSVEDGVKLRTTPLSVGLEKVEAIGFGLVLMDLRRIGPKLGDKPWFDFTWRKVGGGLIGEDVYFCRKVGAAGVSIYVDHDLSRDCAHIGSFEFRTDSVAALREVNRGADN
jgi:hypothetical protein